MKTLRQMGFALPLFLAIALHSPASEAKLVEIWGSGLTGYGWGQGNGDNDFYRWVRGGAVGFEVGAKVLFIGAFVDYLRWFGGEAGIPALSVILCVSVVLSYKTEAQRHRERLRSLVDQTSSTLVGVV